MSLQNGEKFPPHNSHRNGKDVDIRPMRNDGQETPVSYGDKAYSSKKTQSLVDIIRLDRNVESILFNDPNIRGIKPYPGHNNHLHIHFKE